MPDIDSLFFVLGLAAFFAGLVDAVVGGGGLIQIPALFAAFPTTTPATLFGTNKLASVVGTSSAAIQYGRRVAIPWRVALPGAAAAFVGSWFGAKAVAYLPPEVLKPLILALLITVAIYTFWRKDFGTGAGKAISGTRPLVLAIVIGAGMGFYDGFFGPGTGSFLIFLFVRCLGMDFLRASVTAKILNVATNVAAIAFFAFNVEILWRIAAVMALCNLSGAVVGSRLALRHGAGFVRKMFLFVVCALITKMLYDLIASAV
ncbi:sulfite exporter TauE/SafE family protein [Aromatoleum diolicum]|uniref:Probable membrane transporter protein n=1 Tax=Aromatoleum diolicum TaxID=75796 RepID=A0ABX1QEH8_9RHOO|nr:TSUP family transporter [Aromatoleum diolicum]NMG76698.1 TSUP family transporter [Aromatoleum diolicum]